MIRPLTPADLAAAMSLKQAAGWNQTREDWDLVMRMAPSGCFGLECGGALAATASAVCYGRELAWIGMVLTAPEYRGRGFARRLMEHALEYLERAGVAWIKLDATDMGYPLYRKLGFEDECAVERWMLPPGTAARGDRSMDGFRLEDWRKLDRRAFGADRAPLLAALAVHGSAAHAEGYAMGRPGANAPFFGPCAAASPAAARALLGWFRAANPGEPVFWDLLPHNRAALALARESGFERRRKLIRMVRRGAPGAPGLPHDDACVFALAGFEYG